MDTRHLIGYASIIALLVLIVIGAVRMQRADSANKLGMRGRAIAGAIASLYLR